MTEKIGVWIGLISTSITILLTVLNFQLNRRLQGAEVALKEAETKLKIKTTELEVSREKTERYEFVNKLLPDILANDQTKVVLTSNLIALALSEDEAQRLFSGLSFSKDQKIQSAGKTGIETIKARKSKYQQATDYEINGINALIKGNFNLALTSFESAEEVYPTFHCAYEISKLLRDNKKDFRNEDIRKFILNRIINDYSLGIPEDKLEKLIQLSK